MKTFNFNQNCSEDDEVYCISHVPKVSPGKLDGDALGIQAALNVPKSVILVNEQIRRHPESAKGKVECLEDHSAATLNQNILTCDNLEILCDSRGDFKIENEFEDTTSPSISSGTSSLSSVISSSSSIDEIHFQMSQSTPHTAGQKIKKNPGKKTREIAFLAVLNLFPVQKLIFVHF